MSSSRRRFLGALGAGALLPALPTIGAAATPGGAPVPTSADWDMSWVPRITGTHRAVFDVPDLEEGAGLFRAGLWPKQVREVYGADTTVSTVLVLRHNAIDLVMGDAYWARFPVAKEAKWKNPETRKWWTAHPMRVDPPDTPPRWVGLSVDGFLAWGGIILACDLAFRAVIARYRDNGKVPAAAARVQAQADLIPGVIMLPSGFFATIAAQDAGCRFMPG